MLILMTLEYTEFYNTIEKWYQKGLAFMVYLVFERKSSGSGVAILVNKFAVNCDFNQKERPLIEVALQQLAEELHWPIIRKLFRFFIY